MPDVLEQRSVTPITPAEAHRMHAAGELSIIDVRTEVEHATVHAVGVEHIPLDQLSGEIDRLRGKTIACICKSGARGGKAAQQLIDAGIGHVYNVVGGTEAWAGAGLPVVRQSNVIPLERQVLIGAGSLVLAGVALAHFVNPLWIILSAFVGCGLVLAGLTGFCGMAMVLSRMPWNRGFAKTSSCAPACASR